MYAGFFPLSQGFSNSALGTTDIWAGPFFAVRPVLCPVGRWEACLASTVWIPGAPPNTYVNPECAQTLPQCPIGDKITPSCKPRLYGQLRGSPCPHTERHRPQETVQEAACAVWAPSAHRAALAAEQKHGRLTPLPGTQASLPLSVSRGTSVTWGSRMGMALAPGLS